MWIVTLGLQLGANAIIATLINHTAGFDDDFTIAKMVLFYTARPRLAWIFLSVLSLDSVSLQDSTGQPCCSSAMSTMSAEIVLGLITLSSYVRVAHLGSSRGYYHIGAHIPSHAKLMYAGALLYTVCYLLSVPAI